VKVNGEAEAEAETGTSDQEEKRNWANILTKMKTEGLLERKRE
jgi:hypothetical protein